MKPGLLKRFGAAWVGLSTGASVAKSAFTQAFLTGRDGSGADFTTGKLVKPYEQSAWINRAVQLKVDEIARVPVKFYDGTNEFTQSDFLAWWSAPFLTAGGRRLPLGEARKELASWPDLEGEFFILLGDDWLNPFASRNWKALSRPILARPEKMRHVIQGGKLAGWAFTDAGGRQYPLLPEQVIHSPLWNPYDDFRGLATVKVVMNAAEGDYLAGVYVRNLMRNNGDQGVYVISKNGSVSDEQREQIVASLREKRMRALRGDFSAAFITGDVVVEDAKAHAPGPELTAGRVLSQHEIFLGLGVPPSMADVKASYSIGADSDRFTLITGTCMPLSARVDAALTLVAAIMLGRARLIGGVWEMTSDFCAEADWDDHPVVQHVRRERVDTAIKLFAAGMPIKNANDYLDLGMKPFAGWDKGYLPFNIAPVSADAAAASTAAPGSGQADPAASPEFDETVGDGDVNSLRLLILARARSRQMACERVVAETKATDDQFALFTCGCHGEPGVVQRGDRPARELAHWRTLIAPRRSSIKAWVSAIGRVLMQARVETLKKLEASKLGSDKSIEAKSAATAILFDLANFTVAFRRMSETRQKDDLKNGGEQLFEELKRDDVFSYPPTKVIEYLHARQNRMKDVPQEFYDRVKRELEQGFEKGETHAQLAARVKTVFNGIADGAARTIALTETSAAYNNGRAEAMKQAGVQYKAWLTSGNPNVRDAHFEAGLTYSYDAGIPIDEPFIVDGEELMFPGDDAGSAANVINCHCISIAVRAPEEKAST